ncbi:AMP-binding enzyme family protein (macronuclear) [Tetrahymena thermophila SB210]|uniref:AMP-binding enzyme family protein n=1 Tax=Tetrahymena thermophila (strain SB210) TaxID=312017 RepID=Q22HB8_TETTS|nr:AMP-binding enzyme family protein [Tetrahymena thermophila SB210]EAR84783.2 AMP-binding enzyme family protein [Tetrahymena thermophila SB210]|eukprot:XP_001032446.2 AMP-binding enzyme family protein [Tetrahymena thermophila SB210]
MYSEFKVQTQITKVTKGLLIQSQNIFSSPISQQLISQSFSRQQIIDESKLYHLSQLIFDIDENVTFIDIQFPTFIEVLALCNSVLSVLLFLGIFCRKQAQKFIRRDIFFILLKNFFSRTYLDILQHNNIIESNDLKLEKQTTQDQQIQQNQTDENDEKHNILPICLSPKSNFKIFEQQLIQDNLNFKQDFFVENENSKINKLQEINEQIQDLKTQTQQVNISKIENIQRSFLIESQVTKDGSPSFIKSKLSLQQQSPKIINFEKNRKFLQTNNQSRFRNSSLANQSEIKQNKIKNIKNLTQQVNQNFEVLSDDKLYQKSLEDIIFQTKFCKKNEFLQSKGINKEMLECLEQSTDQSLDFFSFYKEILFLKKAVMIMLSKEQMAALKITGIGIETLKYNQESTEMNSQTGNLFIYQPQNYQEFCQIIEEIKINHLKEQFEVMQSEKLQIQYINLFLQRFQNTQNLDIIDKRILSSLSINM